MLRRSSASKNQSSWRTGSFANGNSCQTSRILVRKSKLLSRGEIGTRDKRKTMNNVKHPTSIQFGQIDHSAGSCPPTLLSFSSLPLHAPLPALYISFQSLPPRLYHPFPHLVILEQMMCSKVLPQAMQLRLPDASAAMRSLTTTECSNGAEIKGKTIGLHDTVELGVYPYESAC